MSLLQSAGFAATGKRDVTAEYLHTVRAWIAATEPVRDLAAAIDGEATVDERLQGWREDAELIEHGWLKRTIYWGARP